MHRVISLKLSYLEHQMDVTLSFPVYFISIKRYRDWITLFHDKPSFDGFNLLSSEYIRKLTEGQKIAACRKTKIWKCLQVLYSATTQCNKSIDAVCDFNLHALVLDRCHTKKVKDSEPDALTMGVGDCMIRRGKFLFGRNVVLIVS